MTHLQQMLTVTALSSAIMCAACQSDSTNSPVSESLTQHQEQVMIRRLDNVLRPDHKVARIYYNRNDECRAYYTNLFPLVNVGRPSESHISLKRVEEIFHGNSTTSVTLENDNVVKVRIGHIPQDVLNTKIQDLSLTSWEQYNPPLAISAILNARKVKSVMDANDIVLPVLINATFMTPPAPGLPHLSSLLSNVTVDQALDQVARVFSGVVMYNTCLNGNKRMIYVTFRAFDKN